MEIENVFLVFLVVLICSTLFLGFLILLINKGWKDQNRLNFAYLTFAIVIWQISSLFTLTSNTYLLNLFWARLSFAAGAIVVFFLIHFVIYFPQLIYKNSSIVKFVEYLSLLISLFISSVAFNHGFIEEIIFQNNTLIIKYGPFYPIFLIGIIALLVVFITLIFLNYKHSNVESRQRIKWLFIGSVISASIVIFMDVIGPLIFSSNIDFLSNFSFISSVILVGFTAYAIVKHQLFDIRVILTETAAAIVVLSLFVQTLLSENLTQWLINGTILILVTYGGYLLIKSVQEEIKRRKQLQILSTQLAQANEHLKELDKMKTEFVSLASHELLTPVSAIEGYLSMLLDEKLAKVDDPKAKQYLDRVYRSAKRLARLVADMLNVSRIEEGRLLVEKKEVDLSELIKQTVEELKFKAEEKKQKIVFENPDGWETYGDPDKIKEVIVNLIGNSIKFSKESGEITLKIEKVPTSNVQDAWLKVEADIKARPLDDQEAIKSAVDERLKQLVGGEQLLISVKDQGVGIPKEELPRLFKKFHRVGDYTTAESQGTGLGLYISRALAELHHGRIWADSEGPSHGSTFTFSLPVTSSKKEIEDLEAQVPQDKEQLKPLARPMKEAEEL